LAAVFVAGLVLEHSYIKHGHLDWRRARMPFAAMIALSLTAGVAPTPGLAQSETGPTGLPDLVSDPAFIWVEQVRTNPVDGRIMSTLAFDGILHNIGAGALDLAGNPQIEGGVKQRVFDGDQWEDVGAPPVEYETDDGHNHFHLMDAAVYSLWNEGQTEQIKTGDKVGFCLLDTSQIERGVDAAYLFDEIDYCNTDDPDSTDLRMGISPGWVDIYEASLTFQWVDTSNTLPGRYWVGSQIDPNNVIVESNEDNNGVVFSSNKYAVSGHNARELPPQASGEITLKSTPYGTTGQVAYVIADGPVNGTLSVPVGHDLLSPTFEYVPNPGFVGTDSFSYYAHDTASAFPLDSLVVEVVVEVSAADGASDPTDTTPSGDAVDTITIAPVGDQVAERYDRISIELSIEGQTDEGTVQWFAMDLPTGLTVDPETGEIAGEVAMPGEWTSTITAQADGADRTIEIDWIIADAARASLRSMSDFSTVMGRRDIVIGSGTAATKYRATGLPDGMVLTEGQPSILGAPTEFGAFEVVVEELLDGEVVESESFTLTVRPAAKPQFVL